MQHPADLKSQIREALRIRTQPCTCMDGKHAERGCFGGVCEDAVDRVAAAIEPMWLALEACGAPYISEPGTVFSVAQMVALEFIRRQNIAATALPPKEST